MHAIARNTWSLLPIVTLGLVLCLIAGYLAWCFIRSFLGAGDSVLSCIGQARDGRLDMELYNRFGPRVFGELRRLMENGLIEEREIGSCMGYYLTERGAYALYGVVPGSAEDAP